MKTVKLLFYIVMASLLIVSCERNFEAPPIKVPKFDRAANTTIAKLKEFYSQVKEPVIIDVDFVIRGYVSGDDRSGNIYKQIFIQDKTGAISIGIDQNSIFNTYRVGQEVAVELKGFAAVKYGDELQIGYKETNANRIPWEIAQKGIHRDGWPDSLKILPKTVKIGELSDAMVNTLVKIENIYFVNGGKNKFTTGDKTTDEAIRDNAGRSISVRTSSFASFAKDNLPKGSGSLVGILGRYRGSWQLIIRNKGDIGTFSGTTPIDPDIPAPVGAILQEGFGKEDVSAKPKVADYKGFDSKYPVSFYDNTEKATIRTTKAFDNHLWFPKGAIDFGITGINTKDKKNLYLSYDMTANLFEEGSAMNVKTLSVTMNGVVLKTPDFVLKKEDGYGNKYYTVTIDVSKVPQGDNITLKFTAVDGDNTLGIRLDNIKLFVK